MGRALILGDLEGVVGVDDWRQILATDPGYPDACTAYAADLRATVRGLRTGGADDVFVIDTHASGNNIAGLDVGDCRVIDGPSIMGRIDEAFAIGVDALVLLGFHAAAGTVDGFVPHSFAPATRSWLNGELAGEPAFYCLLAASKRVPTVMITGDRRTITQLAPFAPNAFVVQTKEAESPWEARSFDAEATRAQIEATAAEAYRLRAALLPERRGSLTLTIEARSEVAATLIATIPGMVRDEGFRAPFSGSWNDVWRAFISANSLAALAASAGGSWFYGPIPGSLVSRLAEEAGQNRSVAAIGAYIADHFSPPWGPACPDAFLPRVPIDGGEGNS